MESRQPTSLEEVPVGRIRFGGYEILEHLGRGGMGDVYMARQVGLDRLVALKILPPTLARTPEFSERFYSEAYAIARLQHHNIVTIYDYGEEEGQKFIAMQYVQGQTLSHLIHEQKPLEFPRIVNLAKQVCRGLKYAHQRNVIHRDIKSGNVMVDSTDRVLITDFGIAQVADSTRITTTGMTMGTPEYMSPEQCEGGEVDAQSDIYGLGIMLFEMVCGSPPFLAETPLAVAYKQVHEVPPLLTKKRADVPKRLELIVAKCLKKLKHDRYFNADELLEDLDSVYSENPVVPPTRKQKNAGARITDRRERSERRRGEQKNRSILFTQILGWLSLGVALGLLADRQWGRPDPGLRWMHPREIQVDLWESNGQPELLFDGKGETSWMADKGHNAVVDLKFAGQSLLTGISIQWSRPDNSSSELFLALSRGSGKAFETRLPASEEPVFLALPGLSGKEFRLHLKAAGPGIRVDELRLLGLPYE